MKLGVLFSGGKDSTLALHVAAQHHEIVCLITVVSQNEESYMYHTPNIHVTELQAQALALPILRVETSGEKEAELAELETAIKEAKKKYKIEGVVSGAVRSTYQASRIQRICHKLNIWSFNPLWLLDQVKLLRTCLAMNIHAIISGVFAEPFNESFLGKNIDDAMIRTLSKLHNPAGEGGEIETTVLDAPMFKQKIVVDNSSKTFAGYAGRYTIEHARLVDK